MRTGDAALIPEAISGIARGDVRVFRQFAEDFEDDEAEYSNSAQQFGGLFNVECRETWAAIDLAARSKAIDIGGIYGLDAKANEAAGNLPTPGTSRPAPPRSGAPGGEVPDIPTLLLSRCVRPG